MGKKQGKIRPSGRNGLPPPKEHQWRKGQSGNPNGRPPGKSITTQLREMLDAGLNGQDLAKAMAQVAFKEALKGDFKFWNAIMERLDGKLPDTVTQDGALEIVVRHVRQAETHADDRD